jgi:Cof subfamily protein (haloacid dehalogenase superfamily)
LKKLFAFDIDGTLLTADKRILPSTKEALKLIQAEGHEIMLASARAPLGIEPLLEEFGARSLYISLNGSLVVDGDRFILDQPIPEEGVQQTLDLAREYGLSINLYSERHWFIEEENPYSTKEGEIVRARPELADFSQVTKVHKLLIIGSEQAISRFQPELQAKAPLLNVSISTPTYCEVVAGEVSKASALKFVCEYLGIGLENTIAFGDGENDLEMLTTAGTAVAMGNSHPSLFEHADYVTLTSDEDGILEGVRWALSSFRD